MKLFRLAIFVLLIFGVTACVAQDDDNAAAIRREHWTAGVLASGGTGLFDRTNVQYVRAGCEWAG